MNKFVPLHSRAAPLLLADINTDIITPMRRLGMKQAHPLAHYAFEALRYLGGDGDSGQLNPEFVLNRPEYQASTIMLTGRNFGCGSSRETAPAAIADMGFRCLIGTSFGDIFFKNCFQQGILAVIVEEAIFDRLVGQAGCGEFTVDLQSCEVRLPDHGVVPFEVNPLRRESLLEGLDEIGLTLKRGDEITAFQTRDHQRRPWVYDTNISSQELNV
jgi:3-isopropylmalate/(R)-2-methylmalate dehydratase small subunit